MKSQKEGIIAASVMALLILGAASSFSLMPVTHAQSVSSVTWNFREADKPFD